jgi:hypothetical protein
MTTGKENWRDTLNPGDCVLLRTRTRTMQRDAWNEAFYPVQRVTPTQVTVDGLRFRKSDGQAIGLSPDAHAEIHADTAYLRNRIENHTILRNLDYLHYKWAYLPPEFICEIGAMIAPTVQAIRELEQEERDTEPK